MNLREGIMVFLGVVLIVLGVGFLFLGFAGAVTVVFKNATTRGEGGVEPITKLIDAIAGLVKALTAAPTWLALVTVGLILIGAGGYYLGR